MSFNTHAHAQPFIPLPSLVCKMFQANHYYSAICHLVQNVIKYRL
jgi:hypothetical protein